MKTNISALMSLIAEEEKIFNSKIYTIRELATSTSIQELDGRVNVIEDNKEMFETDLKDLERSYVELSRLKAILYEKNNFFKLSDGRCIQQAIIDNTNLRKLKSTYEQLLLVRNSKRRVTEVNNSYFECNTINFDVNEIRNRLNEIDAEIQKTDFEISKLNSMEFEI